jgi:Calx-beta domain-containing protein/beta-propeller repeat-containing protein
LKLSPAGNSILFATYAGGSGDDFGNAIAVDSSGFIYAIGDTDSTNLSTVNPLQSFNAGGFDAFLAKLNPSGSVVFSTYAGGNGHDAGTSLALDSAGNIYAVGYTNSTNLALIVNPVQPIKGAGYDAFIAKLNTNGSAVVYSTYLGGNGTDAGYAIATDSAGNVYVIGETSSTNFPLMNPLQGANGGTRDAFTTKLSPTGSAILFSTYLGGSADDNGYGIAVDGSGNAYLIGETNSTNFFTANPLQATGRGGYDAFIAKILTTGTSVKTVQFSASGVSVNEVAASVTLTVTRLGDASQAASVDYHTIDDPAEVRCDDQVNNHGAAYARCDYATSNDTLSFAAAQTTKSLTVPIINDGHLEAGETFQIVLTNPSAGLTLGTPSTATVTITDNDTSTTPNPILRTDDPGIAFFVRQHYLDFLAREPEPGEPWSAILRPCANQFNVDPANPSAACDRLTVSGAFFGSPEFLNKGVYTIVFYRVAFNRLPQYAEFAPDLRSVTGATQAETFAKRAAFANEFVLRPAFVTAYGGMTNDNFVTALMTGSMGQAYNLTSITTPDPANPDGTAKVTLTTQMLKDRLNGIGGTLTRAQVLRAIAQSDEISLNREAVNAFVASQYYGYLRRTPDTAGFNSWITYLSMHPGDFRTMVNGFMNSTEYRLRFGPP